MNSQTNKLRLLIVDDEERICNILAAIMKDEGYEVETAKDGVEAINKSKEFEPQVAIVDLQMPRIDGIETITRMRESNPSIVPIILTAHGTIRSAVQATKQGVYDYLTKPFDNDQILVAVRRAFQYHRLATEVVELKKILRGKYGLDSIIGTSAVMSNFREETKRIANTDATVLIEGESGTGKELAAKAIHYESLRRNAPLIVVDCGAIPANIIESEFFGHEKGAFTDARDQRIGKFEEANGGSIFLDEIGELPLDAQTKLLRVLQEKEITRVGANVPINIDVRVIAATNKSLEDLMHGGKFREDLFYRLNVLKLDVPPLREHKDDIPTYVEHFIEKHKSTVRRTHCEVSEDAKRVFMFWDWSGNVRELENAVQRAMLSMKGDRIEASDLSFLRKTSSNSIAHYDGNQGLEDYIGTLVAHAEKEVILRILEETRWNRSLSAEKLKISRKTLFNKMQQYGINEEAGSGNSESEKR